VPRDAGAAQRHCGANPFEPGPANGDPFRVMTSALSLQERYAPTSICFGCGPANRDGLRIRSFETPEADAVVCTWEPLPMHQAFPGMMSGGIVGTLLDCHSNWTAAWHIMVAGGLDAPLCCVTAEYSVKLRRPTPFGVPLHLRAWIESAESDRAIVRAELGADGKITATCLGTFIAVKPGHLAYHRWS